MAATEESGPAPAATEETAPAADDASTTTTATAEPDTTADTDEDSEALVQQTINTGTEVDRDDADAPTDIDEEGDDPADGKTEFILVTSFEDNVENTGKVWVIPEDDEDEGYVLISGLDAPVSLCFDVNNDFLYVVDATLTTTGQIF